MFNLTKIKSFMKTGAFKYIKRYNYVFISFIIVGTLTMLSLQVNRYVKKTHTILTALTNDYGDFVDADYYCRAVGCEYIYDKVNKAMITVNSGEVDSTDIVITDNNNNNKIMFIGDTIYVAVSVRGYTYYTDISYIVYYTLIFSIIMYLLLLLLTMYFTNLLLNDEHVSFVYNTKTIETRIKHEALYKIGYNITHEVKTPLLVISSILEEIKLDIEESYGVELNSVLKSTLDMGDDAVSQIYESLRALDMYKRIELSNGNKNIYMLAESALTMLGRIEVNKITTINIDERFKLYSVYHDDGMTNGFFLNILMNHIKNSLEAGSSIISLELHGFSKKGLMEIDIIDNGMGVPPDIVGSIFDLNVTTKNKTGTTGRGSGMYYNKTILSLEYGGDIQLVKTRVNKGAVFRVCVKIEDFKK